MFSSDEDDEYWRADYEDWYDDEPEFYGRQGQEGNRWVDTARPAAPQRRNTLTYTDLTGEIVVVDLTGEESDNAPQQQAVPGSAAQVIEVTVDDALSSVLQVLPDVDPSYVKDRFSRIPQPYTQNTIPLLLSQILDDPSYPRINRKRSAAAANLDEPPITAAEDQIDYSNTNRIITNPSYKRIATDVLCAKFPNIPMTIISQAMRSRGNLYAPTFLYLHTLPAANYRQMNRSRAPRASIAYDIQNPQGREVAIEIAWVETYLEKKRVEEETERIRRQEEADAEAARELNFKEHELSGGLLECGCCFDELPANTMTCCGDGHLFCLECAKRNAETVVGNGGYVFRCMDGSGCKAEFTALEINRFTNDKILALRDKLASEAAIREASIEDFVSCPFCNFGAIIENQQDKEFRCQNVECQIISCRSCRLESHIPLSCEEHAKEHKLSAKHQIEEAMTAALVQKCSLCSKPFIKLHGCNKMTCPCGNLQCYVCGKSIKDYRHFEIPGPDGKKCPLYEETNTRLETKILEAREQATKKVLEEEEGLREEDIRVEVEKTNPHAIPLGGMVVGGLPMGPFVPVPQQGLPWEPPLPNDAFRGMQFQVHVPPVPPGYAWPPPLPPNLQHIHQTPQIWPPPLPPNLQHIHQTPQIWPPPMPMPMPKMHHLHPPRLPQFTLHDNPHEGYRPIHIPDPQQLPGTFPAGVNEGVVPRGPPRIHVHRQNKRQRVHRQG